MAIPPPSPEVLNAFGSLATVDDVAALFGTTRKRLFFHLYARHRPQYRLFLIKKRSGGTRPIASPPPVVAAFQYRLLQCLTERIPPKDHVHGFVVHRNVATNAAKHVKPALVLNIDLLDFFPSIHFGRVRGMFQSRPFNFSPRVAAVLSQVCCRSGTLPQGASTSPMISNLICRGLDRDLARFARSFGCRYTRYADDMTFSTDATSFPTAFVAELPTLQKPNPVVGVELAGIVKKHSFEINSKKTHLRRKSERQEVTGLVVNERVNVPREFIKNIRAILFDCEQNGIEAAQDTFVGYDSKQRRSAASPDVLDHVRGKLAFVRMVKGADDPVYVRYALRAERLAPRKDYGIIIGGRATKVLDLLSEPMWVLVGRDAQGMNLCSGTAFCLDGFGIVSARHIFDIPPGSLAKQWELRNALDLTKAFPVTAYRDHSRVDLTIVETSAPLHAAFRTRNDPISGGHPVTLAGFPNWNTIADKLYSVAAHVSQNRTVGGLDYLVTSVAIHPGLSGGPILASDGSLAGVVVAGSTHAIFPNSGLTIKHLALVAGAPLKKL